MAISFFSKHIDDHPTFIQETLASEEREVL